MNIKQVQLPASLRESLESMGGEFIGSYMVNGSLQVFIAKEMGLIHLSVSHPRRYPTWDEIRDLRYELLPNDKTFAILLPPKEQYVNRHPNCFHLHEVPEMHEEAKRIITL